MEKTPLISVVIPAYNVEKYVERCLSSILNQSFRDIEVLVYDDGSVDRTWNIISRFSDERLRLFRGTFNRGVVYARNLLLREVRGQFVAFQDADDWSDRDRLLLQLAVLMDNPSIAACGSQFIKVINGRNICVSSFPCDEGRIKCALPDHFQFLPGTILTRTAALEELGLYSSFFGNDGNEDLYLIAKIVLRYGIANIDRPLYYYTLNIDSLTKLGSLNRRKLYIHEITRSLLTQSIEWGTDWLESGNINNLLQLENSVAARYGHLTEFHVFEKTIGELLFFRQYRMSIRLIVEYLIRTWDVVPSIRLLSYVLKQSCRYEG